MTQVVQPRAAQQILAREEASNSKIRVSVHPYQLELNDIVEEPWVCMGDEERDGCQNENP